VCKKEQLSEIREGQLLLRLFRVEYIECEIISKEWHLTSKSQAVMYPWKNERAGISLRG
jgi:hypothetical protein